MTEADTANIATLPVRTNKHNSTESDMTAGMKRSLALIAAAACIAGVHGQVEARGRFRVDTFFKTTVTNQAVHMLPARDNAALAKAADDADAGTGAPFKFAEAYLFELDMNTGHGEWREDRAAGVRRWRLQLHSPGALSLSFLFSDFDLPDDAEFYVIGKHKTHGAYTAAENHIGDRTFAVGLVKGDSAILEYVEPLVRAKSATKASIHLHKVVHGFRAVSSGTSGSCNIDAACADGNAWRNQINSVGMILTNDAQRFCSGAMVNNVRQDGTQYFLTANHCIFADVTYFMVGFNYQWSYCKSGNATGPIAEPTMNLVQGLTVVSKWDKSDFALLLVKEKIPDSYSVYMSGWDTSSQAATNVVGIHHPSGDVKKISTFVGRLLPAAWTEQPARYHWEIPRWTRGVTEPGSSGSPIFNSKGLVVGHLHGGQSACDFPTGYDMYGALASDWATSPIRTQRLLPFLNPTNLKVGSIGGIPLSTVRQRLSGVPRTLPEVAVEAQGAVSSGPIAASKNKTMAALGQKRRRVKHHIHRRGRKLRHAK